MAISQIPTVEDLAEEAANFYLSEKQTSMGAYSPTTGNLGELSHPDTLVPPEPEEPKRLSQTLARLVS